MIKKLIFISLCVSLCLSCKVDSQDKSDKKEGEPKSEPKSMGYKIGDKADDFEMKHVDGKMYSLGMIENVKGYIVIFTSNTCPFAVAYEDRIIDLHNRMLPKGYSVVAINSNDEEVEAEDSYEKMVIKHEEENFPFLYLDDENEVYRKFGATKTPHVFLLDNDLVVRYIGAIDDSAKEPENVKEKFLENAIAAIESGKTPEPETTKAVGCSIKTKKGKGSGKREAPSPDMILEKMDTNKDNFISKDEVEGPLSKDFDRLDADKDGKLSKEELSKMKKGRGPK